MKTTRTIIAIITTFIMVMLLISIVGVSAAELPSQAPDAASEIVEPTIQTTPTVPTEAPTELDKTIPHITKSSNTTSGIKLTWSKVSGAYQYRVFIKKTSGGWKSLGYTKKNYFTYTSVDNNKDYTFTVRACNKSKKYTSSYDKEGYTATYYKAPTLSSLKRVEDGIKVNWKAVDGIEQYKVYVKRTGASSWTSKGIVTGTSYTHTSGASGKNYTYTVRCVKDNKVVSDYNSTVSNTYYETPTIKSASLKSDKVVLNWDDVNGAYQYRVLEKTSNGYKGVGYTKKSSYTLNNLATDKDYTFTVRACNSYGDYISAVDTEGITVSLAYIVTQEEHTTEECLYQKKPRSICAKCGKDITDDIQDEQSIYYGWDGYKYHLEIEKCNSNWRVEYHWFDVKTNLKTTDEQYSNITNIFFYNETHSDKLEYRYKYSASCKVEGCYLYNKPILELWSSSLNNTTKNEVQAALDAHKAEHEIVGDRVDATLVTTTQFVYRTEHFPKIAHYELTVK